MFGGFPKAIQTIFGKKNSIFHIQLRCRRYLKLLGRFLFTIYSLAKNSPHFPGDTGALLAEASWIEAQHMDLLHGVLDGGPGPANRTDEALGPRVVDKLDRLVALYRVACQKASELLVSKMQAYDLPVLVPSAAVIAVVREIFHPEAHIIICIEILFCLRILFFVRIFFFLKEYFKPEIFF